MVEQNDSFIDEVTEDLRRDRLFGLFRRYGWIAGLVVVAIVGGAIWREWSLANARNEAQTWGDAVIAAENAGDPAAILQVDSIGSADRAALTGLLGAAGWADNGSKDAALVTLRGIAANKAADPILAELAQLKLVMLAGASMDAAERDKALTHLSRSNAPFQLLALEQKAIALVEAGRTEDAITLIREIASKPELSGALRQRLSDMMIALGEKPESNDTVPAQ